jgi:NAD(P)-dependent dehydrogenase (short-subunit alcohol dehydrogenase family)
VNITTAVVTGAASGIGRALATRLAASGARLVLADSDAVALAATATALGATAITTDVSDPDAMEALAAGTDVELVCLNAGILGRSMGPPWEVDAADWSTVFAVNVVGVVNGLRAFVPRLLAADRPAHILITASLAGLLGFPGGGAYGASKHAVVAVAEQTALALADTPITVSVLCPALVRTAMSAEGEDPLDIAAEALDAVEAGRFVVAPEPWRAAILRRAERLAAGRYPALPEPG